MAPAATVELVIKQTVVSCVGLIDTGADVSVLDKDLFRRFGEREPLATGSLLVKGLSTERMPLYYLELRIRGESERQVLSFTNVPVGVMSLHRPLIIIGRRGVLDRLRVELDFPKSKIVLTRRRPKTSKYPHLAREFLAFESIMDAIKGDRSREAILQLSWEIEQFLDRLIREDRVLRMAQEQTPPGELTLHGKFDIVAKHRKLERVGEQVRTLVEARNQAVHGVAFKSADRQSIGALLAAAESVLACFS